IRPVQLAERRHEEARYLLPDQWQKWNITQSKPLAKCGPLRLLGAVLQKLAVQSKWHSFRNWRAPPFESASDRTCKPFKIERMGLGQRPDIEEVLHSAVRNPQRSEERRVGSDWSSDVCSSALSVRKCFRPNLQAVQDRTYGFGPASRYRRSPSFGCSQSPEPPWRGTSPRPRLPVDMPGSPEQRAVEAQGK